MKPKNLLFKKGLFSIMSECDNNIRAFKAYIYRECPNITAGQWYYLKKLCEQALEERFQLRKDEIIVEFKERLKEKFKNDNII